MAPVIMTGDMPPIWSQMYFHVQPFSRLMSRSFSVRSARFIACLLPGSLDCRSRARLAGLRVVQMRRGAWRDIAAGDHARRHAGPNHGHVATVEAVLLHFAGEALRA